MALPAALAHGTVTSLGCIGNRVYTGLSEDDLYVAIPGADLPDVADALEVITSANAELSRLRAGSPRAALHGVNGVGIDARGP